MLEAKTTTMYSIFQLNLGMAFTLVGQEYALFLDSQNPSRQQKQQKFGNMN